MIRLLAAIVSAILVATTASGSITVFKSGPGVVDHEISFGPGGVYDIAIWATGEPIVDVFVIGNAGETIRNISVVSDDHPGPGTSAVRLSVQSAIGTPGLARVERITQTGGAGELLVQFVDVNGNVGVAGTNARGGVIEANYVNSVIVRAGGWITADIIARAPANNPSIDLVQATEGGIIGSVIGSSIGRVIAAGPIGINNNAIRNVITAFGDLKEISGTEIHAQISTFPMSTTRIQRLAATSGDFTGSLVAGDLVEIDPLLPKGISIAGQVSAFDVLLSAAEEPIVIGRLAASRTIKLSRALNASLTITQSQGLQGQIIIRERGPLCAPFCGWFGTITVG